MARYTIPEGIDRTGDPEEGTYCVFVYDVDESKQTHKGTAINGVQVTFSIICGTTPGQEKLTYRHVFWDPDESDPKKFKMALRSIMRFYEVCTGEKVKAGDFDMPWPEMKFKYLVIKLEKYKDKLNIAEYGRGFYDVEDPAVADCPIRVPGLPPRAGKVKAAAPAAPAAAEEDPF